MGVALVPLALAGNQPRRNHARNRVGSAGGAFAVGHDRGIEPPDRHAVAARMSEVGERPARGPMNNPKSWHCERS